MQKKINAEIITLSNKEHKEYKKKRLKKNFDTQIYNYS